MKTFFVLLFGIALGIAGTWWVLVEEIPRREGRTDTTVGTDEAKVKRDVSDTESKGIEEDLESSGQVVRRKARDIGEAIVDAASDAAITTTIKGKLVAHAELSAWDISVSTTDGRVTLSGEVDSPALIGEAITLVMEVDGVRDVASTLTVKSASPPPSEKKTETEPEQPIEPEEKP